jgi:hypothetical protein
MLFSLPDRRLWFSLVAASLLLVTSFSLNAYAAGGHDLPPSNIGDRQVFLSFNAPSVADPSEMVAMSYSFMDKASGDNVRHVTYFLTVSNPQGEQTFSEVLHGHDGTVNVQFRPGDGQYKVNANYDNLAASYVADQGGLITVVGPVFADQGSYTINVEVNGIDYDNTFLPEPIKYDYVLTIAEAKNFDVQYQDTTFNVTVSSPPLVEQVTLNPDNKQLVIQYPSEEWQHFDNFQVYVDIPNEMMSGPFTASFNGMQLQVTEEKKDDKTTTLILNGTHLDVIQMNNSGDNNTSGSMERRDMDMSNNASQQKQQQQNSIVITATNAVPEFLLVLPIAAAAIATAIMIARKIKTIQCSLF